MTVCKTNKQAHKNHSKLIFSLSIVFDSPQSTQFSYPPSHDLLHYLHPLIFTTIHPNINHVKYEDFILLLCPFVSETCGVSIGFDIAGIVKAKRR